MNIAVIGSGISGLSAAWLLGSAHNVTLFEQDERLGGHSNTVTPITDLCVDTGFIVYNERTYPNLIALFNHLDVKTIDTDMSFGISLDNGAFEYSSNALFAQKRNLFSWRYYKMLFDIVRFYKTAPLDAYKDEYSDLSLSSYLEQKKYSKVFIQNHLLPMAAAIWSAQSDVVGQYPLSQFVRFCDNHGLLNLGDRPKWRTVDGGSKKYIEKIKNEMKADIRKAEKVTRLHRHNGLVELQTSKGRIEHFDQIILACHADQSLALLDDASQAEKDILQSFPYLENNVYLHTDKRFMPRLQKSWSSWNYLSSHKQGVAVTYWMNKLQPFVTKPNVFVTLNPEQPIAPEHILSKHIYHHPHFTPKALLGWKNLHTIQGKSGIWFCGAWCGNGFHEDGLSSGLAVAEMIGGVKRPWVVEDISPAGKHCKG